jgi:hypothetical protein
MLDIEQAKKVIRKFYEQLLVSKFENVEKMRKKNPWKV